MQHTKNIPQYIEKALDRRARAARIFDEADSIISKYLIKNHWDDLADTACFLGGVESITNPELANEDVRNAIRAGMERDGKGKGENG